MPEGPEVATVGDWLRIQLVGKHILSINVYTYNRTNKDKLYVPMSRIEGVTTSGKKIFIHTTSYVLQSTLAMTGKWTYTQGPWSKLSLVLYEWSSFGGILYNPLYYDDKLGMGWLHVYTHSEYQVKIKRAPPCLLADNVSYETFRNHVLWDQPLYRVLNDQKYIGGIGNYLRAEILYAARISPLRFVTNLSEQEMLTLYQCTMSIIRKSYECGGCALKDYEHPDGIGKSAYSAYIRVYGRESGFSADGYPILAITYPDDKNKQTMYWCPDLQK